jgi:hypothetical protein
MGKNGYAFITHLLAHAFNRPLTLKGYYINSQNKYNREFVTITKWWYTSNRAEGNMGGITCRFWQSFMGSRQ